MVDADRSYVAEQVDFDLPVTINRHGHKVPIPNGTFVQLGLPWRVADVDLYARSDYGPNVVAPASDRLKMKLAGVGSIIDNAYSICSLELTRASLGNWSSTTGRHHLGNVYMNMHYLIAFAQGLYWARYDWVEVVRSPAGDVR